jgi:hypothetical protein
MTDRELRQFKAMQSQLSLFVEKAIDLGFLISSLEFLYHALENTSPIWLEQFWSHWAELEQIYSICVVYEQPIPSSEHHSIKKVIDVLQMLVAERISSDEASS